MELILKRIYFPDGVNGTLYNDGKKICHTIELPWKENQRQISCIPEGRYELKKRCTPRFGDHLLVRKVPGRSSILIHAFNHAIEESRGCIAPVSFLSGEGRGLFSRNALEKLVALTDTAFQKGETIFLTIKSDSK